MATIDYTPPATVNSFIRHHLEGELFYSWILGPVGSGKTTGLFFKLVYMASLQAPSPLDGVRRSRAVIVRNTMPQLRDTTLTSWNYWFKDGEAGTWRAQDSKFTLRFNDVECEVLFRPLDTPDDVARVLSLEVTFAILDEFVQINREIVDALSSRCGRYPPAKDGGATNWGIWGSSNPGNEDDWWFSYLYDNLPSNARLFTQPSGFSPDAENLDNLPGHEGYYINQAKGKPVPWTKQYIEVEWGYSLSGKPVVPTFSKVIHVAEGNLRPNPLLPMVIGFDPGVSSALVFGQVDLFGRLVVFDELVQEDFGADRLCTDRLGPLIKARYATQPILVAPDPAANSRNQTDERSVVDVLRKHKYKVVFPDMNNRLQPRLQAVEHFTTRLTEQGPALIIAPRCKALIRALGGGWRYAVDQRNKRSAEPDKNHHSHVADAFTYLCRYYHVSTEREARRSASDFTPPKFINSYAVT
jgi:hypothetical protein